jgi:hypothetical protein
MPAPPLRPPHAQIAVQVALMVAKAARFDFPQHWPRLFEDLLSGLGEQQPQQQQQQQQQGVLRVRRTYFVLHHVLKELSSKRLAADQKAFAQVRAHACGWVGGVGVGA